MPWSAFGIVGLLSLWAACGLLPWCLALVAKRGEGALTLLPLAIVGGMAGGLLTAVLFKDWTGFAASLPVATAAGAVVLTLRMWPRRKELQG